MIKAKVVSLTIEKAIGSVSKLDLETYLEDRVGLSSFCVGMDMDWAGLDAVIMTKEEYEAMGSDSDVLRKSLLEERKKTGQLREEVEKLKSANFKLKVKNADFRFDREIIKEQSETIQKLEEENMSIKDNIRDLEEKMAQEVAEVEIRPGGTIIFRKKRVSELEKEVEKLKKSKSDMWLERNTLKAENERLQKKIEDLDKSNKRLNGQYIQLNCENITLKKKLERLQDAAEVNIHTDGPIVFRQLEEENKDLKNKGDEFSLNIAGTLFYSEGEF